MVLNRRDFIAMAGAAGAVGFCGSPALAQTAAAAPLHGKGKKDVRTTTIVVLGDSLSAEYGLRRGTGWVALLEKKLAKEPIAAKVVNASISGDTTSGGRARLAAVLEQHHPTHLIIELGGNDALRGLQMAATESNLRRMVALAREAGSQVLLIGMMMPPNYGAAYGRQFAAVFRRVAETGPSALVPFLLEGFGEDPDWFQRDRIHPLAKAQPRMLDNVWPTLKPLLSAK
jgi:acyl-CoA thioesterase-1